MLYLNEGISYSLTLDIRPYNFDAKIVEMEYGVKWAKSVSFLKEEALLVLLETISEDLCKVGEFRGRATKTGTVVCKGALNRAIICRIELNGVLFYNDNLIDFLREVIKDEFRTEFIKSFIFGLLYHPAELDNEEVQERNGLTYVYGNKEISARRDTEDGGHDRVSWQRGNADGAQGRDELCPAERSS